MAIIPPAQCRHAMHAGEEARRRLGRGRGV